MRLLLSVSMNLGEYIERKRLAKNWSQRDLARYASLSHSQIRRIEAGEILNTGIETLRAIAVALGVPVGNLVLAYQGKDPDAVTRADVVAQVEALTEQMTSEQRKYIMKRLIDLQ